MASTESSSNSKSSKMLRRESASGGGVLFKRGSLRDLMAQQNHTSSDTSMNSTDNSTMISGLEKLRLDDASSRTVSTRTCSTVGSSSTTGSVSLSSLHSRAYDNQHNSESSSTINDNHAVNETADQAQSATVSTSTKSAAQSLTRSISSNNNNNNNKHNHKQRSVSWRHPEAQTVATVTALSELDTQERLATWWCPQEYQAIRLAAKYSTKQIRKSVPETAGTVARAFDQAVEMTDENRKKSDSLGDSPSHSSSLFHSALTDDHHPLALGEWCTCRLPTRGLEKYVGAQHKQDRQRLLQESKKVVMQVQQACQEQPDTQEQDSSFSSPQDEQIGQAYHDACRYAVLFARFLAMGDAHAVDRPQQDGGPNKDKSRPPRRKSMSGMNNNKRQASSKNLQANASNEDNNNNNNNNNKKERPSMISSLQRSFSKRQLSRRNLLQRTNSSSNEPKKSGSRRNLLQRTNSTSHNGNSNGSQRRLLHRHSSSKTLQEHAKHQEEPPQQRRMRRRSSALATSSAAGASLTRSYSDDGTGAGFCVSRGPRGMERGSRRRSSSGVTMTSDLMLMAAASSSDDVSTTNSRGGEQSGVRLWSQRRRASLDTSSSKNGADIPAGETPAKRAMARRQRTVAQEDHTDSKN